MLLESLSRAETTTYAILFPLFCIFCHSRDSLPENMCDVHQRQSKVAPGLDSAFGVAGARHNVVAEGTPWAMGLACPVQLLQVGANPQKGMTGWLVEII